MKNADTHGLKFCFISNSNHSYLNEYIEISQNDFRKDYSFEKQLVFKHGAKYFLPDGKILIPSYHPSPRNVNTKIINNKMMTSLFIKAKNIT